MRSYQQTGELPLWCPYSFAGSAFVHDPQVAMFYPPHMLLLLLPEEYVGAGLSWLIVCHLIIAGWGAYAYGRSQGLGAAAALVAGCGFMFAGKWMLHLLAAGHYITIGLAWLPWVLLLLEGAIRRGSFVRATAAGAVFALLVLGTHPQWTFYSGLFLALWTLGPVFWPSPLAPVLRGEGSGVRGETQTPSPPTPLPEYGARGEVVRWAACGIWVGAGGGCLGRSAAVADLGSGGTGLALGRCRFG